MQIISLHQFKTWADFNLEELPENLGSCCLLVVERQTVVVVVVLVVVVVVVVVAVGGANSTCHSLAQDHESFIHIYAY